MAKAGRKEGDTPEDDVKKLPEALQLENQNLRERIIAQETAKAGGAVSLLSGETDGELPRITGGKGLGAVDFGELVWCRVLASYAPPGVKVPDVVTVSGRGANGKSAERSYYFITDTPIRLPEKVVAALETCEEREHRVLPDSPIYAEAIGGNLAPAREDCQKQGFEKVEMRRDGLYYVSYLRNYSVIRAGSSPILQVKG